MDIHKQAWAFQNKYKSLAEKKDVQKQTLGFQSKSPNQNFPKCNKYPNQKVENTTKSQDISPNLINNGRTASDLYDSKNMKTMTG